jgi:hypothetical protein
MQKARLDKKVRAKKASLVIPPPDVTKCLPSIDTARMFRAIADRSPTVWDTIIEYLVHFESHCYKAFGTTSIKKLNEFIACVYAAMSVEGFSPSGQQAARMIQTSHIFQHLVAVSSYQNNDGPLDSTLPMQGNVPKILFLMNPRCEIQMDQHKLFDTEPTLSSLWFSHYMLGISSPTQTLQRNIFRHLANMDERWSPMNHCVSNIYFGCTYHNPDSVLRVKGIINASIQRRAPLPSFVNTPRPAGEKRHIAIVTSRWHRNHAVYKSASPLVEQLVGEHDLTLVWTNPKDHMPPTAVTDYFDRVLNCYLTPQGHMVIPDELKTNDFDMLYYPDIGMSDESIWMSNMRIAPIQAVGYGHPDSTGPNNEIDYFIGGDVEKQSTDKYAETMVLLPGLAQEPAWPTAPRQNNYKDDGIVRINCVWGPDKYNFSLLQVLALINKKVAEIQPNSKHEFHLFASPGVNRYAALPAFCNDVRRLLPNAVVHSEQEYYDYMVNAEMHDFSLNSFPFGCYNVLIESLYMGLPFLTLVGDRFYNRAGMYLNEKVDMEQNNFTDPNLLVLHAAQLITDPDALRKQREHLAAVDLKERLFTLQDKHFLQAVNYMLTEHPFTETKIIGDDK